MLDEMIRAALLEAAEMNKYPADRPLRIALERKQKEEHANGSE